MKILKAAIRLLLCFLPAISFASLRVAFFKFPGEEKGDRFYHVAVSVGDQWMSAEPYWGVRLVKNLSEISRSETETLVHPGLPNLTETEVSRFLGLPFDPIMDWSTNDRFYCSELIAKIFGMEPSRMIFDDPRWPQALRDRAGQLGISPDEVYQQLLVRGFILENESACEKSVQSARSFVLPSA